MLRGMELSKLSRSTAPGESQKISGNSDSEAQKLCFAGNPILKNLGRKKEKFSLKKIQNL